MIPRGSCRAAAHLARNLKMRNKPERSERGIVVTRSIFMRRSNSTDGSGAPGSTPLGGTVDIQFLTRYHWQPVP